MVRKNKGFCIKYKLFEIKIDKNVDFVQKLLKIDKSECYSKFFIIITENVEYSMKPNQDRTRYDDGKSLNKVDDAT